MPACEVCGKVIARKYDLLHRHMPTHMLNPSMYYCPYIGCPRRTRGFLQKGNMNIHINSIHADERTKKWYYCHYEGCGQRFSDPSTLARHEKNANLHRYTIVDLQNVGDPVPSQLATDANVVNSDGQGEGVVILPGRPMNPNQLVAPPSVPGPAMYDSTVQSLTSSTSNVPTTHHDNQPHVIPPLSASTAHAMSDFGLQSLISATSDLASMYVDNTENLSRGTTPFTNEEIISRGPTPYTNDMGFSSSASTTTFPTTPHSTTVLMQDALPTNHSSPVNTIHPSSSDVFVCANEDFSAADIDSWLSGVQDCEPAFQVHGQGSAYKSDPTSTAGPSSLGGAPSGSGLGFQPFGSIPDSPSSLFDFKSWDGDHV